MKETEMKLGVWVGIDWGHQSHAVAAISETTDVVERSSVPDSPVAWDASVLDKIYGMDGIGMPGRWGNGLVKSTNCGAGNSVDTLFIHRVSAITRPSAV